MVSLIIVKKVYFGGIRKKANRAHMFLYTLDVVLKEGSVRTWKAACLAKLAACGCGSIAELIAKARTAKISAGASGGIFAKVCTSENFPLDSTKILRVNGDTLCGRM